MNIFMRQFQLELLKLFARKRTYIGFGAFLAAEILILSMIQLKPAQRAFSRLLETNGFLFQDYFSGLTMAFLMTSTTVFILGSLYVALVSGDMVAKEVEDGTLRMILCRPVSRLRLLLVKYLACITYTASLMFFIVITSLLVGISYKGLGNLFVYAPLRGVFGLYATGPGLMRFCYAASLLCLVTTTTATVGFTFSCFNMKPAAATVVTLSLFFIDFLLQAIPYFESIRDWFLSYHISCWLLVFQPHIPWWKLLESLIYLMTINVSFLTVGVLHFTQRDFKS